MSCNNYKLKYIKYKKKYFELKKIRNNLNGIMDKIIILPNEYSMLDSDKKYFFNIYEQDKLSNPISYIKKDYLKTINGYNDTDELGLTSTKENYIREKKIITPDEYYLLSDSYKSNYEIYESDYDKFPNRVVPKNYIKIK